MFTQQLDPKVFTTQREFIRIMNANKDFYWWITTLVAEESAELRKAHEENEGMEQVFKEFADLVYVVAGFYNTMPRDPKSLLSEEQGNQVQRIFEEAEEIATMVFNHYKIPPELIEMAFYEVHRSNMSKLDDDGNPIRREDGKILKGPNYTIPDMSNIVKIWEDLQEQIKNTANEENTNAGTSN